MKILVLLAFMQMVPTMAQAAMIACSEVEAPCDEQGGHFSCYCYGWCTPDPFCSAADVSTKTLFPRDPVGNFTVCAQYYSPDGEQLDAVRAMNQKAKRSCGIKAAVQVTPPRDSLVHACAEFKCQAKVFN